MNLELFIGRFHPVVVHLPIGFIMMAMALEVWAWWTEKRAQYVPAIKVCLGLGTLSGLGAIGTGWFLSTGGSYSEEALSMHQWLGFATIACSGGLFLGYQSKREIPYKSVLFVSLFGLLSATGHNGGNLTHGSTFLVEHAPPVLQQLAGYEPYRKFVVGSKSIDSVQVYPHLIRPIFEAKCMACHNNEKTLGNLNMTVAANLFQEAETGIPVVAGKLLESKVYERITLPHRNPKHMPPDGNPLNFTEIQLIQRWIELGADTIMVFQPSDLSKALAKQIQKDYGLDYIEKPFIERIKVAPITNEKRDALTSMGLSVKPLGQQNNLLDIQFQGQFTEDQVEELYQVATQITWLDLRAADLTKVDLDLSRFKHLTRLNLVQATFKEDLLKGIQSLKHLEFINLYESNITESALAQLDVQPSLKRLYVGKTALGTAQIQYFIDQHPNLEVIH